ncbi:aspartate/glutamate racemase family protein [Aeromonas sp. HMWF036]|uniref:aspartate/glutamate racemase family protein n=1 Tax=Aeromonas TaxID=642 RepID=UPI0002EFCC94|nr:MULTISPECIES: aspartate/glutamate racemase family protein [Aeromonas]MCX9114821.1 aspartate/glutamate racemase family protein [Aeromonas veronii]MDR5015379.1 aspartate/glutamate racemase family protein [Aeromonas veronii]PTS74233.1 aspartate/glutamate racemase family protein [Aeromonas sp. HMWF036]PTT25403.1 aspartate/glutamate racemase family protein [Aeromonas sp. HMWF017]TNI51284.1 aspartate racemase [Aeromonas veronii]
MKCIGLLGGMSWESTVSYYQALNRGVRAQLGGLHSARVLLNSVDFAGIERLQHAGDWPATARLLAAEARKLQDGGADFLLIGTNTMHKVAPEIEAAIDIPLLHIADATAAKLQADGITRVGLLGTRFTMEQDFYKGRLQERFGLAVLVPDEAGRERVHRIIYDELCLGEIRESSRAEYLAIIEGLAAAGAEAVILGCTEIALLVGDARAAVPLYDTTAIHAEAAVALALASD